MNYQEYIKPELLCLVPILYFLGSGLKQSNLPDKWIPVLLGISSIFFCTILIFSVQIPQSLCEWITAFYSILTQGILVAGASVYANQIYRQAKKDE